MNIDRPFLGRAEGSFHDSLSRIKYFAISNKIYDMKTTLILNREYKKLPSAGAVIKLPRRVNSRNSEASVSNDGKILGFCFC